MLKYQVRHIELQWQVHRVQVAMHITDGPTCGFIMTPVRGVVQIGKSTACYEGQFVRGVREGLGVITAADGALYEGSLKDNLMWGPGASPCNINSMHWKSVRWSLPKSTLSSQSSNLMHCTVQMNPGNVDEVGKLSSHRIVSLRAAAISALHRRWQSAPQGGLPGHVQRSAAGARRAALE